LLEAAYPFDGRMLKNITAETIDGISGIDNNTAFPQDLYRGRDLSLRRIDRVNMQ
jgi:hypothetical protein